MKIIPIFVYAVALFAFLTIGSLMIIVSLHVLSMEDALLKVQELYENPWQSFHMGAAGVLFVFTGLLFAKVLVKKTYSNDNAVLYGKWGSVTVSRKAIDALIAKTLRKFEVVRGTKVKTEVDGSKLKIAASLTVLDGWSLPELIHTIQDDLSGRLRKILGDGAELEISVNVVKIVEPQQLVGGKL